MKEGEVDLKAARERIADSLKNLNGYALLTLGQQKLVRVALQMREMYPSGEVSSPTENAIVCYNFIDRVENEMMLSRNTAYTKSRDGRRASFLFSSEESYLEGRGKSDELIKNVKRFGYPCVVSFGVPSQISDKTNTRHIVVVLGEERGEPIIINKDANYPFDRVPLRGVIKHYDNVMFKHYPNWRFGIRKLHKKDGIIEPQMPTN